MRTPNSLLTSVIVAGTAISAFSGCQNSSGTDAPARSKQDDVATVKVVQPVRKTLKRTTTQPASIHAFYQAELFAKVAGYLETLNVDIGSPVEKGDVLATVAVPELEKAYERQQATIERLKLEEKRYEQAKKLVSALREQAAAEVAKTVAQLNADELEFNRVRELVANDAVAGRLLDEARKKFEASQAAKKAVEAALESAKANVFVAEAESLVAKEATRVAGKRLEEMYVVKSFATITAPFKGVITERHVDPGDLVRNIQMASDSSRKPLFCVAQIDKVRVRIYVPENEAPWADKGDPVTLSLRSLPDWKPSEEIKISRIARSLDRSTQTMLVECDLLNNDNENQLLPGMYGRATIILDEKDNALMLPASAVRYAEDGRAFVYIVRADSTIQIVDVQTGADDGKQIEITSDLDENARVVEAMIGRLAEDQMVKVQE